MTLILAITGLVPSIIAGWFLLRGIEGRTPVCTRVERCAFAGLLGPGATMLLAFICSVSFGLPLTRLGFVFVHAVVLCIGIALWHLRARGTPETPAQPSPSRRPPLWAYCVGYALILWSAMKTLLAGSMFLLLTPTFLDDTLDNWNLRAKVFFYNHAFTADLPRVSAEAVQASVSSYPPPVPLLKAWLVTFAGQWSDAAANLPHLLWFIIVIVLVVSAVKRHAGGAWAMLAGYGMVSLPLYLIHGTNAYADVFLSAHIAAAIFPVFFALRTNDAGRQLSWLRIGAVMTGMLIFTKNEASVLYLPPLLAMTALALFIAWKRGMLHWPSLRRVALWYAGSFVVLGLPWLTYKWVNGLAFGNAKQLSSLQLQWHDGVGLAVFVNTFFEANWLLLFPLVFLLIVLRWKQAFRPPLAVLTGFFLIAYTMQLFVFFFTPLAYEAIRQTGYARGLVHLIPGIIVLTVLLLRDSLKNLLPDWMQR